MRKNTKLLSSIKLRPLGSAISITGVSVGMYLDFLFKGAIHWSVLFLVVSILLVADWKNLLHLRFPGYNGMLGWIILFQGVMLFYGCVSGFMSTQYMSFHLFIIALCFGYSSISNYACFEKFPYYLFFAALPSVAFGAVFCALGLFTPETIALFRQTMGKEAYTIDALTASTGCLYTLFPLFCISNKTKKWKLISLIALILALYVLLICNKRTPIFVLFIGIVYVLYLRNKIRLKVTGKTIRYLLILVVCFVVLYNYVDVVHTQIDKLITSFETGLKGLFTSKIEGEDRSVEERLELRKIVFGKLDEFTPFNYIFGMGYYIVGTFDLPLYQSYLDMGIIGLSLFLFVVFLFPLRVILRRNKEKNVILACLLCLYGIFTMISSGNPYLYTKYVSVCLLAYVYYANKKYRRRLKQ